MHIYDSLEAMEAWTLNRSMSKNYDTPESERDKVENATVDEIVAFAKGITLDTVYFLKGDERCYQLLTAPDFSALTVI